MFVQGQVYRRRDLHKPFRGQRQGGISTPSQGSAILLFTGESGEQYGYRDGWSNEGIFLYTDEGQHGDMQFSRGNLAIREHATNGKDLHLFQSVKGAKKGRVRYVGQMVCTGSSFREAPDPTGKKRRAIIFELTPLQEFLTNDKPELGENGREDEALERESLDELRKKATASSASARTPRERRVLARERSQAGSMSS